MKQKISIINDNLNYCVAIVATFVFYVLAHGYRSSNLMFSHDSLQTIYQLEWKHKVSLGRYVQPLVWIVRGKLTMPWLVDIGAVVFMIASVVMLVRIFGIKKYWMIVCISGVICTYATFTFTNATFIHESDVFMLALFCSLLSVYLNNKYKYGFLIGAIPLCLSIGLYQLKFLVRHQYYRVVFSTATQ